MRKKENEQNLLQDFLSKLLNFRKTEFENGFLY
jgi:hypothetical protein